MRQEGLEIATVSGASLAGILLITVVLFQGVPPSVSGYCRPMGTVTENGSSYRTCTAVLNWSNVWYSPKEIATTVFEGVFFDLHGYDARESLVVNVTGHESSNVTQSFLLYTWCGPGCSLPNVTVLSPDGNFGGTWNGGSSITLLVRSP